ncbi:MAG TPA: GAF domain-containing protein, partial [Nitrososphaera sp.]|nr:GAF domain-containing protein [Nitrososphaera sp.]
VAIAKDASLDSRFKLFHNLPEDTYHAFLSVPILHKGKLVGVINSQHKKPHRWDGHTVELMEGIAHLIGSAIENARLYEETKKKAGQIETLSKVSGTIVSGKYLEEILHLIVTMAAQMMGSKICSIMLLDEVKQELAIKATQSLSEAYRKKPPVRISKSVSGMAVSEKKPVSIRDVRKEKNFAYSELAQEEGLVSLLCVPMMLKNRVIGVINTYTAHEHEFSEEEVHILQAIANQSAIAIENTNLMEESLASREALEVRKLVERAKGILMKEQKISESESYRLLQQQSMNLRKSMKEIAQAIILASEIKM